MPGMRVHELAKEYGLSSKDMLTRLRDNGIAAKSHASILSEEDIAKVRETFEPEVLQRSGDLNKEERAALEEEQKKVEEQKAKEEAERKAAVEKELAERKAAKEARGEAPEAEASGKKERSVKRIEGDGCLRGPCLSDREREEARGAREGRGSGACGG